MHSPSSTPFRPLVELAPGRKLTGSTRPADPTLALKVNLTWVIWKKMTHLWSKALPKNNPCIVVVIVSAAKAAEAAHILN